MTTEGKLLRMFYIQDHLNSQLDEHWVTQGWDFRQALMVEAAEFSEHIGYKWWKKQTPDLNQARLELVDMWHFIMSYILAKSPELTETGTLVRICENWEENTNNPDIFTASELVMRLVSESSPFLMVLAYRKLCRKFGLGFEELYKLYVGKAALNEFRWENGYGNGSYVKVWGGKEDNEYLTVILNDPESDDVEDLMGYIKQRLSDYYRGFKEERYTEVFGCLSES